MAPIDPVEMEGERSGTQVGTATVVVPLDGSEGALAALPVARTVARLLEIPLQVVHIAERVLPPRQLLHKLALDPEDVQSSIIEQADGEPAEAIARVAAEQGSPFIVLCTFTGQGETARGARDAEGPTGHAWSGRVTAGVLARASCPVLLVPPARGRDAWFPRHALFPFDGAPSTAEVACPALGFAQKAGTELTVLHVTAPGMEAPEEPGSIPLPRYVDQVQHEWPEWAREFVHRVCWAAGWGGRIHLRLTLGDPVGEILESARDGRSDLIILGCRRKWEGKPGAVARAVIRDARCPVLVL